MRIAQVAPLHEACPPRFYGGTERVVSYLTEELVRSAHIRDSLRQRRFRNDRAARADLRAGLAPRSDSPRSPDLPYDHVQSHRRAGSAIRCHTFPHRLLAFCERRRTGVSHGDNVARAPRSAGLAADLCRIPRPAVGVDLEQPASPAPTGELVRHGAARRAARSLRPRHRHRRSTWRSSAASARKSASTAPSRSPAVGLPLKIAAKVDKVDHDYFESVIDPLLRRPGIEFLGEISDFDKAEFLGNAAALLFPIDWPEPFGLAMIEAMANGTPVVAFRCGAVPEVIDRRRHRTRRRQRR